MHSDKQNGVNVLRRCYLFPEDACYGETRWVEPHLWHHHPQVCWRGPQPCLWKFHNRFSDVSAILFIIKSFADLLHYQASSILCSVSVGTSDKSCGDISAVIYWWGHIVVCKSGDKCSGSHKSKLDFYHLKSAWSGKRHDICGDSTSWGH